MNGRKYLLPQVSILGQRFNVFINHIFLFLQKCDLANYTDDSTLYDKRVSTIIDSYQFRFTWFNHDLIHIDTYSFFISNIGSNPNTQSCLHFQDFQISMLLNGWLVDWPNKQVLSVFQWSVIIRHWHTICHESKTKAARIGSLAICINIKTFNRVNRKQMNILKTFLEYLKFQMAAYWRWFGWRLLNILRFLNFELWIQKGTDIFLRKIIVSKFKVL